MSIPLKTPQEIAIMREGGKITGSILYSLQSIARAGVTTKELNSYAEQLLAEKGAVASFKGFEGYPFSIVTCVNDEVVHGLPSDRVLQKGDLLTIDFGTFYKGFHTDSAYTIEIEGTEHATFLRAGERALEEALKVCKVGNTIGDIGFVMDKTIAEAGYDVVWQFVGHGVGRELHEPPEVPGYGDPHTGIPLTSGMVLAVEVMYAIGSGEVKVLSDGWTAATTDGSLSAMFEHSVAITPNGPLIITKM